MSQRYSENRFYILLGIYVGVWGMMPMLTIKLIPLSLEWFGLGNIAFSYGAFTHAITFPCTDAVSEIWGAKRARILVFLGFFSFLLAKTLVFVGTLVPPMPFWEVPATVKQKFPNCFTLESSYFARPVCSFSGSPILSWNP